jgi:hypothetical protein
MMRKLLIAAALMSAVHIANAQDRDQLLSQQLRRIIIESEAKNQSRVASLREIQALVTKYYPENRDFLDYVDSLLVLSMQLENKAITDGQYQDGVNAQTMRFLTVMQGQRRKGASEVLK